MASDPRIRASDADRDRTAALLREHHAAGRLTADEFNERLDKAYAAKTLGQLDELLADLPGIDLYKLPDASLDRTRRGGSGPPPLPWMMAPGRVTAAWRAALGSWLSVSLVAFFVWLLAGHSGNLWFLWIAGPYGLILLARWIGGDGRRRHDR
ncbi:MAG TPA: DUF1707 domain-containing protein [Streptosporangiaceae bacterium]|nr:DUF1707 domain-containing protein [Streptosporangiaceae bacterium]